MKKLLLGAILLFSIISVGQEIKFGAKIGINNSTVSSSYASYSSTIGLQIGGYASYNFSDKFVLQPELLYSMQGASSPLAKLTLNYLNIPVMGKYYVADKFNLEAGPQIGFLLSTDTVATPSQYSSSTPPSKSTVDFGINFGAGYDINDKISIDLRYTKGLSNIYSNWVLGGETIKMYNSNIGASLTYRLK
jgi:hypothetical protein